MSPEGSSTPDYDIPLVLYEIDRQLLSECEDGQTFSLWTKPHLDLIYAFEDGTYNGEGKLATMLKADNPAVMEKLAHGYALWLSVHWKSPGVARIQLEERTPAELAAHRQALHASTRAELTSPYIPVKLTLKGKVRSSEGQRYHIGERLALRRKPIESYLDMGYRDVEFMGEWGTIGYLNAQGDIRKRVLRAHFNGYHVTAKVRSVSPMPARSGDAESIWNEEEAAVEVSFHKS